MALPKPHEKEHLVQEMFNSVAPYYDLNNSLLSLGLHHRWKRIAVTQLGIGPGESVLDLCSGTGDLAIRLAKKVTRKGRVLALDLNLKMLSLGKAKIRKAKLKGLITSFVGNAEILPFQDNSFHGITIAFGIRNVTRVEKALKESFRVLRPGGKWVCLEFSVPENPLIKKLYHFYSFIWLPWVASLVSRDKRETYSYLPSSIRAFYTRIDFKNLIEETGFVEVDYLQLSSGIVTIHHGRKPVA